MPFEFYCENGSTINDNNSPYHLLCFGDFRTGSIYHLANTLTIYKNGAQAELGYTSGNNPTDMTLTYSILAGTPLIAAGPIAGTAVGSVSNPPDNVNLSGVFGA